MPTAPVSTRDAPSALDFEREWHRAADESGESRVLSRNGNEVIIEQQGMARFLFMNHPIHLVVRAIETPPTAIDIDLISGDMRHYESRWNLFPVPETGGTRIVFSSRLMPGFYVPGMLGTTMIRGDIERMMAAVLARIDSQHANKAG